jgi:nicotinate dehydrogenase subunit A
MPQNIVFQNIAFTINGRAVAVAVAHGDTPLLDVLRNELRLTGTRFGCGLEQCGCCIVLIDGKPEKSCGRSIASVAGRSITTVEGLGTAERPHVLQQAFLEEQAGQCGYCLSGILVSAKALLDRNPSPSRAEIVRALDDNLCRCGAHNRILRAVEKAAARLREGSRAATQAGTHAGKHP